MLTRTSTILLEGLHNPNNKEAWREFDRRYRPLVLTVARRLGLNETDADDAAQETMSGFIQAYRNNQYTRTKGRLRDWLCGIASHKIRDLQRQKGRRERILTSDEDNKNKIWDSIEDHRFESTWQVEWHKALLRQCLLELKELVSEHSYEIFFAFTIKQWPAKNVAAEFKVSEDVVYQTKHRMLERIRKLLPEMDDIW